MDEAFNDHWSINWLWEIKPTNRKTSTCNLFPGSTINFYDKQRSRRPQLLPNEQLHSKQPHRESRQHLANMLKQATKERHKRTKVHTLHSNSTGIQEWIIQFRYQKRSSQSLRRWAITDQKVHSPT